MRIGDMFTAGISGFKRRPVPLLLGGSLTLGAYAVLAIPGMLAWNDGQEILGGALFIASLVLGGTAAYPWFTYALGAARDEVIDVAAPFHRPRRFIAQFVCAFWFSAAFMLGSLFFFIPALLTLIFYAFYGYVLADDWTRSGVMALGTSVRLGHRRRIALFAILTMLGLFNLCALLPYYSDPGNPAVVAVTVALFLVTTSITMVAGAALYDVLRRDLPDA